MNSISSITEFQNLEKIVSSISTDNKASVCRQIGDLFIAKSEQLIGELIAHPEQNEIYLKLGQRLKVVDRVMFDEFKTSIIAIQRIAKLLRDGDIQKLNSFTHKIAEANLDPIHNLFSLKTISSFYSLHLPADIEKVRAISHPDVRIRIMAQLINRDEIPLKNLNLSKIELMELAPHLTFVDCRECFQDWRKREIENFIKDCSTNVKTLFISTSIITKLPPLPNCRWVGHIGDHIDSSTVPEQSRQLHFTLKWHEYVGKSVEELERIHERLEGRHARFDVNYGNDLGGEEIYGDELGRVSEAIPIRPYISSYLTVSVEDLNTNPFKVLLALSDRLLGGYPLPHIEFTEKGRAAEAVDVGGLRSILISRLMEELASHAGKKGQLSFIKGDHGLMPVLDSTVEGLEDLIKGFRTLGALFVRSLGVEGLQEKVEGILTKGMFISKISWIPGHVGQNKAKKTKEYVEKWVKESTLEYVKKLLFTITGSNGLKSDTVLNFELYNRNQDNFPVAHTCFKSIEITSNYPSYEIFKNKLNFLIEQSTNKSHSGVEFT